MTTFEATISGEHVRHSPMPEKGWQRHRLLCIAILSHALLLPILIAACVIDPNMINGDNGWFKPIKFALSGGIYGATFLWLLSYVDGMPRITRVAGAVTGISLLIETGLITTQVIRGTTSHFNISTTIDTTIFSVMANFIIAVSLMNLLLGIWLVRQRISDRAGNDNRVFAWGIRLGVLSSFIFGMGGGVLMTAGPTPAQLKLVQESGDLPYVGAHAVGVPDGGPGLPFLGWSTEGGDLRIGHFVGLHGLQVLPLLGWLLSIGWVNQQWTEDQRLKLVWIGGTGYLGFAGLLVWQALRGQSIIAPDQTTITMFVALAVFMFVTPAVVLFRDRNDVNFVSRRR